MRTNLIARVPRWLALQPTRIEADELVDVGQFGDDQLAENLADMGRINRWLGGAALTIGALDALIDQGDPRQPISVLDLATGGADIPKLVERWAARRGLHVQLLATDISAQILGIARRDAPALAFTAADACQLPFADRSVDVVMCSHALHHLPPAQAVTMLREMARVARRSVIVNDLLRWWPGYVGALVLGYLLSRNPLTRHDGPLSVLRAYTRPEMAELAARAGLGPVRFAGFLGYRVVMTTVEER